jgi:hypothetical protein
MKTKPDIDIPKLKLNVQETLDELLSERLIPFALTARTLNPEGFGEYTVPFYDSRIHSIRFSVREGVSFKEAVRATVLNRIKTMGWPFEELRSAASSRA